MSDTVSVEVTVTEEKEIRVWDITDASGNSTTALSCSLDSDGDICITLDEDYLVDKDDYELLEKAQQISDDQWQFLETFDLIDPK